MTQNDYDLVEKIEKLDLNTCEKLAEGKTKVIYQLPKYPNFVVVNSKDKITAFNAVRQHELEGKAALSNEATCRVFDFLKFVGFPSHFVKRLNETTFLARKCQMIPIEWVARRVATGSFLKRNQGVPEGFRFSPPKMEMFFKDDAQNDPQWSEEMLLSAKMEIGGVTIGKNEILMMGQATITIFEILEKAWSQQGISLIDMKVEYGVCPENGQIVLADVVDNDSWRLWPGGDRRLQLDKQFYRDLPEVTEESLKQLKKNFAEVIAKLEKFKTEPRGRVVVVAGSKSDQDHCLAIKKACETGFGIPCLIRYCSAHKNTARVLEMAAEFEGDSVPTVFIAVAGLSNGLGPVLAGNVRYPVINCSPPSKNSEDLFSSLNMPSGLFCSTILSPGNAAGHAATILGMQDNVIWSRLAVKKFMNIKNNLENEKA